MIKDLSFPATKNNNEELDRTEATEHASTVKWEATASPISPLDLTRKLPLPFYSHLIL